MNDDAMTPLLLGATMQHELYQSYVDAGFTETQAMQLVIAIMVDGMRAARDAKDE